MNLSWLEIQILEEILKQKLFLKTQFVCIFSMYLKFTVFLIVVLLPVALWGGKPSSSLWINPRNNEMGMFADKRAFRKGDQLTVLIVNQNAKCEHNTLLY